MKPKKRQKLCYNCEGEVDLDVIVCPFCAADLRSEKPEQQNPLYPPAAPMNFDARDLSKQIAEGASAPPRMGKQHDHASQSLYPSPQPPVEEAVLPLPEEMAEEKEKNILGPTILFALGTQLFLFGVFMLLFSHKGAMILKWDARLWFLYIFASVPLLIFGYRAMTKL